MGAFGAERCIDPLKLSRVLSCILEQLLSLTRPCLIVLYALLIEFALKVSARTQLAVPTSCGKSNGPKPTLA